MRDCANDAMRDLLPDLARGGLPGDRRAEVQEHVAGCAACARELMLLRDARAVLAPTPRIDVARIVAALPAPAEIPALRVERGGSRVAPRFMQPTAWRVAAGILAIATAGALGIGLARRSRDAGVPQPMDVAASTPNAPAVEAAPGPVAEPRVAPTRSPAPAAAAQLTLVSGTAELSDAALRALLDDIDTLDAMPLAEPVAELPFVEEG